MASAQEDCPACGIGELEPFLALASVPLISTEFHPTREAAVRAPLGDLHLALCRRCALVWNIAYEPGRVDYTAEYENSQMFSPLFRDFAVSLAGRLADTYALAQRTVVEIGSGKGEFLATLCDRASCRGVGFDPTFDGEVASDAVQVVREYYDADTARHVDAALVVARHVLEHLAEPAEFLRDVRGASGSHTPLYLEVPNAESVFADDGMWDLLYQHVAYFGRPALEAVTRRGGYDVVELDTAFHGQFLGLHARPATGGDWTPPVDEVREACDRIGSFSARLHGRLERWRDRLVADGTGETALWGAGARGVAFLNLLGVEDAVQRVVDLNPRKAGRYLPGTGHRIEEPADLRGGKVRTVLITNPAYRGEIEARLEAMDVPAVVETV